MALQVPSFTCSIGTLPNTYWRWDTLQIRAREGDAKVAFKGYVNADAYAANAAPIGERTVLVGGDEFLQIGAVLEGVVPQQPLSTVIYDFARENDEFFAGAVDAA